MLKFQRLQPLSNEYTTLVDSAGPLNPPILGDFDADPPPNWGVRGAKTAVTLRRLLATSTIAAIVGVSSTPSLALPQWGSLDNSIHLKHPPTQQLARILSGHTAVAISPDGQLVAGVTHDQTIQLWRLRDGNLVRTLPGHRLPILAIAFSPNGRLLASTSHDKTIKLWNPQTGQAVQTLSGHQAWVAAIAFSPDSKTLVSGGGDKTLRVWQQSNSGAFTLAQQLTGHPDSITALTISRDGQRLASSSWNQIKLWSLPTGRPLQTIADTALGINTVTLSPDHQLLISGNGNHTIKLWDEKTGKLRQVLTGHQAAVSSLAIATDGQTLLSGSLDNTIRRWQLPSGQLLQTFPRQPSIIEAIALSPDGHTLASGGWGDLIKLWNLTTGQEQRTLSEPSPKNPVNLNTAG